MGRGHSRRSGMGQETLLEAWDGLRDPTGGPGRVGRPSQRSGMGRGTLLEVQDGLAGPPRGPEQVGGP